MSSISSETQKGTPKDFHGFPNDLIDSHMVQLYIFIEFFEKPKG